MLYRIWVKVLSLVGLTPASEKQALLLEIFNLERKIDSLTEEIDRLEDENKSVWDLIDEIQESSKISPATIDSFVEDVRESVLDEMLKNFKPAGEA